MRQSLLAAGFDAVVDDAAVVKRVKKQKLNPRDCQGASPCLLKLAGALSPTALLVGVDVGKIGDSLAIHIEAVMPDASMGAIDVPAGADLEPGQLTQLDAFAKSLAQKLIPAPVVAPPADAPRATTLEPVPALAPVAVVRRVPAGPSGFRRALPWILGAGAVAAVGTSAAFLGLGLREKNAFDASLTRGVSRLRGSELQAISNRGNTDFTIGLSTVLVGAALGICAALLFATQ